MNPTTRLRVWDLPVRLFHWLLVASTLLAWYTYRIDEMRWHKLCGFFILSLVAFRTWWGFAGSATARFSQFIWGPAHVYRYLRGKQAPPIGHNPLGGWSVVLLLLTTAATAILGLFAVDQDELYPGPLSSRLTLAHADLAMSLHRLAFDGLLVLVVIHVCAVAAYLVRGRNLLLPMITGWQRLAYVSATPRRGSRLALVIGLSIALTVFLSLIGLDSQI